MTLVMRFTPQDEAEIKRIRYAVQNLIKPENDDTDDLYFALFHYALLSVVYDGMGLVAGGWVEGSK